MHRFIDLADDFQAAAVHPKRKKKRKLYKPSYPVILHQRNKSLLSKLWKVEKSLILESKIRDFCRNLPKKKSLILDLNCTNRELINLVSYVYDSMITGS